MTLLAAASFLLVGLMAGALFFALLRWNARLYTEGGTLGYAVALQGLRIASAAGLLALTASHGPLPLLLTALGLLIARPIVLHWLTGGAA